MAEEISAAASKLTGEAKINGDVYVNMVKKAAAKVSAMATWQATAGHIANIPWAVGCAKHSAAAA